MIQNLLEFNFRAFRQRNEITVKLHVSGNGNRSNVPFPLQQSKGRKLGVYCQDGYSTAFHQILVQRVSAKYRLGFALIRPMTKFYSHECVVNEIGFKAKQGD